ncbi:MAG: hypothetical protein WBV59_09620 [Anaerolineae bacterium]
MRDEETQDDAAPEQLQSVGDERGARVAQGDQAGVMVWLGSGNTVGGSNYADRNVISGNLSGSAGVIVDNATNTAILGNYIGARAARPVRCAQGWQRPRDHRLLT